VISIAVKRVVLQQIDHGQTGRFLNHQRGDLVVVFLCQRLILQPELIHGSFVATLRREGKLLIELNDGRIFIDRRLDLLYLLNKIKIGRPFDFGKTLLTVSVNSYFYVVLMKDEGKDLFVVEVKTIIARL